MACATRFGLSGEDGTVWVPGSACSFLRDASEHISGGCFKVPFSLETLNVVATYIERAPSVPEQPPAEPLDWWALLGRDTRLAAHVAERELEAARPELLFEVLRAANFLGCEGLLEIMCRFVARKLCSLRSSPMELCLAVGLPQCELHTAACVLEPVLTTPSAESLHGYSVDDHHFHDEDALSLCLLDCDVPTLRVLKGLSPAWCYRARVALCDGSWQRRQVSLDLDWALGDRYPSLESKRWACCANLCAVLYNLEWMSLQGENANLSVLRWQTSPGQVGCSLDIHTIREAMCPLHEPDHESDRSPCSGANASAALQICVAIWMIAQQPCLLAVDLSGLTDLLGSNWPTTAVRAIAAAVRGGAPYLRSLILVTFDAPISRLRTSPLDQRNLADGKLNFEGGSMCAADMVLLCNAAGDLSHVEELLLSSNAFRDIGVITLLEELPRSVASSHATHVLANLRWLALNDCRIGDAAMRSLSRAVSNGAFAVLEQLCLVNNCIGDPGLGAIANAAIESGSFGRLAHLNAAMNEISDAGLIYLADALRCGALPDMIHLALGNNQLGDTAIVALMSAIRDWRCRARLEYLGLGGNEIGDIGARALGNAMMHGTGLSRLHGLWLADNDKITDSGALALAKGLEHSGRLQNLYLHGLSVHQVGMDALILAIARQHDLRCCVLGRASPETIRRIQDLQAILRHVTARDDIFISSWPAPASNSPPRSRVRSVNLPLGRVLSTMRMERDAT